MHRSGLPLYHGVWNMMLDCSLLAPTCQINWRSNQTIGHSLVIIFTQPFHTCNYLSSMWLRSGFRKCKHSTATKFMMTSSNGNIFRFTYWPLLCGEFAGHRWISLTKASDVELWCFLWSALWINGEVKNREAGDLRCHRAHYDVITMCQGMSSSITTQVESSVWLTNHCWQPINTVKVCEDLFTKTEHVTLLWWDFMV